MSMVTGNPCWLYHCHEANSGLSAGCINLLDFLMCLKLIHAHLHNSHMHHFQIKHV